MIGIKAIASYIPKHGVNNIEQAERFGETPEFVTSKLGSQFLPRLDEGTDTSDLAVHAVEALINKSGLNKDAIDALVVVTQNPDGTGLPHCSAIVQSKLELPTSVAAFDVSLGCSGYVYGLSIVQGLMQAAGLKNAVLVTADPYSKVINKDDRVTSMLFGDAATATWIGEDPVWHVKDVRFGTDGNGAKHLCVGDGHLSMNGRQVFNFAAQKVAPAIRDLLQDNQWAEDDVDAYLMHQGSLAIVDAISRNFRENANKFVRSMEGTGNTVSSSIPILLESFMNDKDLKRLVLSGFGVGFSWATALLVRNQ